MSILLAIETSTPVCSVAISENGIVLAHREAEGDKAHASNVNVFIEEVLAEASKSMKDLDAVAVSSGPGSYTGLRIGVSTAKGLCTALDIPLIAVNTLEAMAFEAGAKHPDKLVCPMIDARRMEVYALVQNQKGEIIEDTKPFILDENSFDSHLKEEIVFVGNGMPKWIEFTTNQNALSDTEIRPLAKNVLALAEQKYQKEVFEDIAYYEPFYLKQAQVTVSKKNFLKN
mgnify:CR=1 FL=1